MHYLINVEIGGITMISFSFAHQNLRKKWESTSKSMRISKPNTTCWRRTTLWSRLSWRWRKSRSTGEIIWGRLQPKYPRTHTSKWLKPNPYTSLSPRIPLLAILYERWSTTTCHMIFLRPIDHMNKTTLWQLFFLYTAIADAESYAFQDLFYIRQSGCPRWWKVCSRAFVAFYWMCNSYSSRRSSVLCSSPLFSRSS